MVRTKYVPYNKKTNRAMSPKKAAAKKRGQQMSMRSKLSKKEQDAEEDTVELGSEENDKDADVVEVLEPEAETTLPLDEEGEAEISSKTLNVKIPTPEKSLKGAVVKLQIPNIMVAKQNENKARKPESESDAAESSGKRKKKQNDNEVLSDSGHNSDPSVASFTKSGRKIKKPNVFTVEEPRTNRTRTVSSETSENEDDEEEKSSRRSAKRKSLKESSFESDSDEDYSYSSKKSRPTVKKIVRKRLGRPPKPKDTKGNRRVDDEDHSDGYVPGKKLDVGVSIKKRTRNLPRKSLAESDKSDEEEETNKHALAKRGYYKGYKSVESSSKNSESSEPSSASDSEEKAATKSSKNTKGTPRAGSKAETSNRSRDSMKGKYKTVDFSQDNEQDEIEEDYKNKTRTKESPQKGGVKNKSPAKETPKTLDEDEEYIDLKKLHLTKQIELMDHEIYLRKLDSLKKERELCLNPSPFTMELSG